MNRIEDGNAWLAHGVDLAPPDEGNELAGTTDVRHRQPPRPAPPAAVVAAAAAEAKLAAAAGHGRELARGRCAPTMLRKRHFMIRTED
jgi:hypothetical protein